MPTPLMKHFKKILAEAPGGEGCAVAPGSAIPFTNKDGHVMRLSGSMKLSELLKMGVVEIHLEKPGTPLREGEWRDASPDGALQNAAHQPRRGE